MSTTFELSVDAQVAVVSALRTAAHRKAHLIATLGPDPYQQEFIDDLRVELEWARSALRQIVPDIDVDDTVLAQCWTSNHAVQLCHAPLTSEALAAQRAAADVPSREEAWRVVLDAAGCSSTTVALSSTPVYEVRSVIGRAHINTARDPEARNRMLLAAAVIEGGGPRAQG